MATGAKRKKSSHDIGVDAQNNIRSIIDATRIGLFREITGRDFGIDGMVEVFDDGAITGKFAFIQCKGIEKEITPLKRTPEYVSCTGVTASNVDYVVQDNSLVILTYASASNRDIFYFAKLADVIKDEHIKKIDDGQDAVTVHIPVANNSRDNMELFWSMINDFYE